MTLKRRLGLSTIGLLLAGLTLGACVAGPTEGTERATLAGIVLAGPVCPVERVSPDPACADRPVAGALLLVRRADGSEVARATSGADGRFSLSLPPGDYRLEPQPVAGLLGKPAAMSLQVGPGVTPGELRVEYDTGIR